MVGAIVGKAGNTGDAGNAGISGDAGGAGDAGDAGNEALGRRFMELVGDHDVDGLRGRITHDLGRLLQLRATAAAPASAPGAPTPSIPASR